MVASSQISTTMNTYAHALDADEIAAAEAMDKILNAGNESDLLSSRLWSIPNQNDYRFTSRMNSSE